MEPDFHSYVFICGPSGHIWTEIEEDLPLKLFPLEKNIFLKPKILNYKSKKETILTF